MNMDGDFAKVRKGDPLAIPAAAYNGFIDAAIANRQGRPQGGLSQPKPDASQNGIIPIRNDTGATLPRWGVVGIGSALVDPATSELGFVNRPAMSGVDPSALTHSGQFAVMMEAVRAGAIAPGLVSGTVPVKVDITNDHDTWADVTDGNPNHLTSTPLGSAEILWPRPGPGRSTGVQFCWVRMGGERQRRFFLARTTTAFPLRTYDVEIGGGAEVSVPVAWRYDWETYEIKADGSTGVYAPTRSSASEGDRAYNLAEVDHNGVKVWGVVINAEPYPEGFRPISVLGRMVWMCEDQDSDGNRLYWFDAMGSHDGTCDAA